MAWRCALKEDIRQPLRWRGGCFGVFSNKKDWTWRRHKQAPDIRLQTREHRDRSGPACEKHSVFRSEKTIPRCCPPSSHANWTPMKSCSSNVDRPLAYLYVNIIQGTHHLIKNIDICFSDVFICFPDIFQHTILFFSTPSTNHLRLPLNLRSFAQEAWPMRQPAQSQPLFQTVPFYIIFFA